MNTETKEIYTKKIHSYIESIRTSFMEVMENLLKYHHSEEVKHVNLLIYPESFTSKFAVAVIPMMDEVTQHNDELLDFFYGVAPLLQKDLDPFDIDYEHRLPVFMSNIQNLFSVSYRQLITSNSNNRDYYLFQMGDSRHWSVNKGRFVRSIID